MKIAEAAKLLGLSKNEIRKLTDLGRIPCRRLGKDRYFIREELVQWQLDLEGWVDDGNAKESKRVVEGRFQNPALVS